MVLCPTGDILASTISLHIIVEDPIVPMRVVHKGKMSHEVWSHREEEPEPRCLRLVNQFS